MNEIAICRQSHLGIGVQLPHKEGGSRFSYKAVGINGQLVKPIPYKELDPNLPWQSC